MEDAGDLYFRKFEDDPPYGMVKRPRYVGNACQKVFNACLRESMKGNVVLTLGGDHSIGLGTVAATAKAHTDTDIAVIWVDAHADINNSDTTDSGNIHGMPVAWLVGAEKKQVPGFEWVPEGCIKPENLVYIGLRDIDMGERTILADLGIKVFSMYEVDKYGIGRVVEMALEHVNPKMNKPIHLSFDVDAMDPDICPATGTPVRGGLTFREGHYICEALWDTGLVRAVDIVEVNPALGDHHQSKQTADIGNSLARASLGETLVNVRVKFPPKRRQ